MINSNANLLSIENSIDNTINTNINFIEQLTVDQELTNFLFSIFETDMGFF
jgi:hypothetical protein